jgi:hypothetical protein
MLAGQFTLPRFAYKRLQNILKKLDAAYRAQNRLTTAEIISGALKLKGFLTIHGKNPTTALDLADLFFEKREDETIMSLVRSPCIGALEIRCR